MTCVETRDRFSARADDALTPAEHAALSAHLEGCAECRRDWERFAATVGLLRAVEPARAPAGFAERVLAAARPEPWHRRLIRGLLVPWPVKIPLEAAAVVLVAGLAVLVWDDSPELRQEADTAPATAPAPEKPAEPARSMGDTAPAEPAAASSESRVRSEAMPSARAAAKLAAPGTKDERVEAPAEVRLAVGDRAAAEREIEVLARRLGGTRLPGAAGADTLRLVVPAAAYSTLTRELGRLGTLVVVRPPAADAPGVTVTVRLTD